MASIHDAGKRIEKHGKYRQCEWKFQTEDSCNIQNFARTLLQHAKSCKNLLHYGKFLQTFMQTLSE